MFEVEQGIGSEGRKLWLKLDPNFMHSLLLQITLLLDQ